MPEKLTVSNTSPLLYLNLINRLDLLPRIYQTVAIPPAVADELAEGGKQGIRVPDPAMFSWLRVVPVHSQALIPVVNDLGAGEAEVIALALENPGSLVIIDDQLGRRIADMRRLTITGTLGIIIKAKQLGCIPAVRPLVEELRHAGLWLSHDLISGVLTRTGEG
jgi:predicted nucleic acid-binding protein